MTHVRAQLKSANALVSDLAKNLPIDKDLSWSDTHYRLRACLPGVPKDGESDWRLLEESYDRVRNTKTIVFVNSIGGTFKIFIRFD